MYIYLKLKDEKLHRHGHCFTYVKESELIQVLIQLTKLIESIEGNRWFAKRMDRIEGT
jgi:hypothetical protein